MSGNRVRRGYLDWLRGVAVLVMIEAHLLDSWTRFPDRQTSQFGYAMILGGFGAPLFLFLAGVAVPLSAGSKFRRGAGVAAAARLVARRGLEIFGLALLFRLQALVISWGDMRDLLKVDILNIMGPAIAAAAVVWGAGRSVRSRIVMFTALTLGMIAATPVVRAMPSLSRLPDALEAYLRPTAGLSNFVVFPWMGFVFAGAIVGVMIDATRTPDSERRTNTTLLVFGLLTCLSAYLASFLPSPMPSWYPPSAFWTTSLSFFFMRIGILVAAVGLSFWWERRSRGEQRWSPLRQLGRTSLFIYWIHVEMVYGLMSLPLHKSLSWAQVWWALTAFVLFMLVCSLAKDRAVAAWRSRKLLHPQAAKL
jgi:uncharacterized membrane protein